MNSGDEYEFLGPALAMLREMARISVRSVSSELGMSVSVLVSCEKGNRELSGKELLKYLKTIKASLEELYLVMDVLRFTRSRSGAKSGERGRD